MGDIMRDYLKEFKNYCLTCKEYDIYSRGDSTHRGFRCKHHQRPMAFDESCSSYGFDYARGNNQIDAAVSFRTNKGYDPSPDKSYWYVVSTICKITSLEGAEGFRAEKYLDAFRTFREQLMTYPNGINFLSTYDVNGLRLANMLLDGYENTDTKESTITFINAELLPRLDTFANMIAYNNHPGAIKKYTNIMRILGLRFDYTPVTDVLVLPELIGPGRTRLLLQSME